MHSHMCDVHQMYIFYVVVEFVNEHLKWTASRFLVPSSSSPSHLLVKMASRAHCSLS